MSGAEPYSFQKEFETLYIANQKPAPKPVSDRMKASIATYPCLGQVTQLSNGIFKVTAILDVHASEDGAWEVALWHSTDAKDWAETPLSVANQTDRAFQLQPLPALTRRFHYSGEVSANQSIQFTVKFRKQSSDDWRWIRDEQNLQDGLVIVKTGGDSTQSATRDIHDIIKNLDPIWNIKTETSQAPSTSLWSLQASILPAQGEQSTFANVPLGIPCGGFLRWFALVRIWVPWLAPRHGKSDFELDKDAILCSFLSSEGRHVVLLAISGANDVQSVFRQNGSGGVTVHARNDGSSAQSAIILIATGDEFESANAAVMYHARNAVMATEHSVNEKELLSLKDEVKPEWMENWYDGLGYCTWNALGQRLTDEKVFNALDKLSRSNVKITCLIIDDNWQNIDYNGESQFQQGWNDFEAEPKTFPKGLKATVSRIREKYPHIQHIAVWHALLGYWGGLAPDGKLAQTYQTIEVERDETRRRDLPLGGKMKVVDLPDIKRFYDDFYRFLSSCGIDGVKTDAQFMTDMWASAVHRRDLINAYLDAWSLAALRHFSIKAISCMSQTPQIIFRSQLPRNRPAMLCRNSDDFFPEIPASHPWHIWTNAHNNLLTQHLNVLPDWDMFQTVHDYSGFHAAARCVSGGPIYVTDVPGEHDMELIGQMTGVTPRGKTVIFRPSVLGKTINPYCGYDDDVLLKVGSYHGVAVTGTPIMGVFNISPRPLTEIIPLSSFPGVLPASAYVVRSHTASQTTPPLGLEDPNAMLSLTLDVRGYEIYTAYPLAVFETETIGRVHVANLGLVSKMTGAAAIVANSIKLQHNGRVFVDTRLKALGVWGLYISCLDQLDIEGDFMITIHGQPIPSSAASVSKTDPKVLEVDVEKCWNDMALKPGWSNEVEIKLYFALSL